MQQISFTGNLNRAVYNYVFIIEEVKETVLDFSKGTVVMILFFFDIILM